MMTGRRGLEGVRRPGLPESMVERGRLATVEAARSDERSEEAKVAQTDAPAAREIAAAAVIGAGTMGRQIAALIASSGRPTRLYDAHPPALASALAKMREEMATLPNAPMYAGHPFRLTPPDDLDAVLDRVEIASDLASAVAGVDIVIEAVREDLGVKREVFAELDRLTDGTILATNSSSIPSSQIAPALTDPGRLLNMHHFAPIWIRPMVEIMGCGQTRPEVVASAAAFSRSLGLVVALVRGESKGFIINRVWRAVKREALRVVDEGHGDPEDVDRLWMLFFGTRVGPFGVMDMVGLDVVSDIETSYQAVAADPMDRPSPTLARMLTDGKLGEKSGEGFYRHPEPDYLEPGWLTADEE
jgi:3-hydroxybutyryl-CoA dehydrogenase